MLDLWRHMRGARDDALLRSIPRDKSTGIQLWNTQCPDMGEAHKPQKKRSGRRHLGVYLIQSESTKYLSVRNFGWIRAVVEVFSSLIYNQGEIA
jgi:hypothetical protein